ncbi:MAG: ferrochelatase [Thermodesulfovibrionales bacterium]
MTTNGGEIGILLLNLGGPDSLGAVRPFLFNLFSDREIIRLGPSFMQKPLAYLISTMRHKKTEGYYRLIGGKSPIFEITNKQARALEKALNEQSVISSQLDQPSTFSLQPSSFKVFIGMRYWHPSIEATVPEIFHQGIKRVIALGLYPHYSIATAGSSFSKMNEVVSRFPVEVFTISSWHDHPLYIESLVEKIQRGMDFFHSREGVREDNVHVLFSAHSLPKKFIEEGDPYVEQIKGTIDEITKRAKIEWDLSYQSKSGPVEWLEPSTDEMIKELAGRGVKNLLVVPISFVSDHIETLYEIDILYKDMAKSLGMRLERAESLNTSPLFISALAEIVKKGMKEAGWVE